MKERLLTGQAGLLRLLGLVWRSGFTRWVAWVFLVMLICQGQLAPESILIAILINIAFEPICTRLSPPKGGTGFKEVILPLLAHILDSRRNE